MKKVKKNVYYCDHCNKRGLSASHMRGHESSCTANPNRYCKLCEREDISQAVEEFKKRFELEPCIIEDEQGNDMGYSFIVHWIGEPVTMEEIRTAADGCPNCILAIIRQCKFNYHYFKEAFAFDYKKELDSALGDKYLKEQSLWY